MWDKKWNRILHINNMWSLPRCFLGYVPLSEHFSFSYILLLASYKALIFSPHSSIEFSFKFSLSCLQCSYQIHSSYPCEGKPSLNRRPSSRSTSQSPNFPWWYHPHSQSFISIIILSLPKSWALTGRPDENTTCSPFVCLEDGTHTLPKQRGKESMCIQ